MLNLCWQLVNWCLTVCDRSLLYQNSLAHIVPPLQLQLHFRKESSARPRPAAPPHHRECLSGLRRISSRLPCYIDPQDMYTLNSLDMIH